MILPIALPGIITGIALRSAFSLADIPFSFWTIVLGHATFCIVVVYNNAVARFRRTSGSMIEAAMDLGADKFQTFRHIILPNIATALLAGGMLAFALSFDEVIVTTFTAGQQQTLPLWMLEELIRPRQRPVTNVGGDGRRHRHLPAHPRRLLPDARRRTVSRGDGQVSTMHRHIRVGEDQMDTEMLIGSRFESGAESRGAGPQSQDRGADRSHPRGLAAADRRGRCGGREGLSPPGRGRRRTSARTTCCGSRQAIEDDAAGFAALEALNCGKPINAVLNDEIPAIVDCWRFFAGAVRNMHGAVAGEYLPGHTSMIRRDADRHRRLDRAVELPADDDGLEARAGARGRQHGGVQALRADAADGAEAGRGCWPTSCPKAWSTSILGRGDSVGNALINHPKVSMISITGDIATGKKVLQAAAQVGQAHPSRARRQGPGHRL